MNNKLSISNFFLRPVEINSIIQRNVEKVNQLHLRFIYDSVQYSSILL
jgi:hypothetical protein